VHQRRLAGAGRAHHSRQPFARYVEVYPAQSLDGSVPVPVPAPQPARGDDGLRSAFGDVDCRDCERFTHRDSFLEEIRYEKDKTIVRFLTKRD
jgi:hypothetical protein